MSADTVKKRGVGDKILTTIETVGNKLPEPFNLFIILFLATGMISTLMALAGTTVVVPGTDDPVAIKYSPEKESPGSSPPWARTTWVSRHLLPWCPSCSLSVSPKNPALSPQPSASPSAVLPDGHLPTSLASWA